MFQSMCLFCGGRDGADPAFMQSARELGALLAEKNIRLIYGGARVGLMGAAADAALAAGGGVTGIIPRFLTEREVAHPGVSDMRVVATLAERKDMMARLSDSYVVLPGGLGTLDEIFEVITWSHLGRTPGAQAQPIFILDIKGFWQPLRALVDHCRDAGFIPGESAALLKFVPDVAALRGRLEE